MREDWIEVALGDLLKLKNGFAFKANNYIKEGVPVFRIGDINDWIVSSKKAVKVKENIIYDKYIVESGDILIGMSGATTGKFGVYNLNEKAQAQLKLYRQAVLKKAFEGKLTSSITNEELRITNADNQKNHSSDNLPKEWKWVKIGDLFSFVTSGSRGWAKYYSEKGSVFIRITNLNFDTLNLDLREEKIQYLNPPQNSEGIRTKVEEGDFLFSITGYLGMFAIAPKLESAFVNQHVCLCRPKDSFNKKYLAYWIIAKSGGHYYLNKNQKGAVKAGLNLDDLKTFPVPLPTSTQEQTQIVQEIESRLSVTDNLEFVIRNSIEKAEALRQSILKKAFEGRLLSKAEIEQCKKEADYEPASELLKKIKAEKAERITNDKSRITKNKLKSKPRNS